MVTAQSITTTMRPRTVTVTELRNILAGIRGSTFVGLTAMTVPDSQRKNHWNAPVRKVCKVHAVTGAYYERALEKAAGQEASPDRAWGEHGEHSALVVKTDKTTGRPIYYLPTQNPRYTRLMYLVPSPTGRLAAVPNEQVVPYLRVRPEVPVKYRDFRLENICSIAIGGQRYRVRQAAQETLQ